MIVEFVQFRLKDGINEEEFLKSSEDVQDNFLKNQEGFITRRELMKDDRGLWTEVVHWDDLENARKAFEESKNCGWCEKFFLFIDKKSVRMEHIKLMQVFE
jgi:hypothetical protein